MKKQIDVVMPYMASNSNGSYYIEYRCYYPVSNRLERFRHYKGFSKCKDEHEIKAHADKLIQFYKDLITSGWRPWSSPVYIYQDETEYENFASVAGRTRKDKNHIKKYFSDFLSFKKSDVSAKTYETYQSKIRRFQVWLEVNNYGNYLINQLSNEIIVKYFIYLIEKEKLDKVTIKNYRMLIGAMFNYFLYLKIIIANPVHNLPRARKNVDQAARPMTQKDIKKFLGACYKTDKQLFLASVFSLFLLTRPVKELRLMKIEDIDLQRQMVHIPEDNAKKRKRVVTISNYLIGIIEEFKLSSYPPNYYIFSNTGEPGLKTVGKNWFNRKFRSLRDELNLSNTYVFYSLKHTGAGELLEAGATLAELMNQLGHTNFGSTIHYVRRHFGEKSQKVMNLRPDFLNGIS